MATTSLPLPPLPTTAAPAAPARTRRPQLRRLVYIGLAALFAAGAVVGVLAYRRGHKAPPASRYETVKVEHGRIVARVTASGTLSAIVTVQVGSQVSGRIQKLHVDFNSQVKKGQVVAEIDPQLFRAAVAQAKANLDAARGNLAKARALAEDAELRYRRSSALAAQKLVAQADLDTARSNWKAAVATIDADAGALEQAQAALEQARVNLGYTKIVSPTDGVVISRNVDVGQTVAASFQAPTVFVIAEDLRKMQVDTTVAEADVGKLRDGMAASFTVDAYGSELFHGVVRQVRNAPQTLQNVVTYDAVIDVANDQLRLKPGMTANVTFVYGEKADVVRVPNAALRFRAPDAWWGSRARPKLEAADRRTVWTLRAGTPAAVPIRVGISDGSVTELLDGELRVGDVLITDADSGPNVPPGLRRVL
jgi:HlyD family secretion protein